MGYLYLSSSEVTTLWRYTNLFIIIIIKNHQQYKNLKPTIPAEANN